VLVVEPDEAIRRLLAFYLQRSGCRVQGVAGGEAALRHLQQEAPVELALLDMQLPGLSGLETLRRLLRTGKVGCVIVMAASGTVSDAIAALREGAYDFVTRAHGFDEVRTAIRNALRTVGLREEVDSLKRRLHRGEGDFSDIIGVSRPLAQVLKLVRKVLDSNITVLIQGQSGTGKELVARAIHFQGTCRERPFVALNCAAIPESLLESELFGHERGAFTGAVARRVGRFEEAHEGTLFLDEVGELSPALQAKLLRTLQTQEIQPIGGQLKRVQVRIISATNGDLLQLARAGRFREDLYYRLAVFPIHLPTLAERREDIPLLIAHFVARFAREENKRVAGVTPEVLERLCGLPWYGNVRELENVLYRAVVLTDSPRLTLADFPALALAPPPASAPGAAGWPSAPPVPPAPAPDAPPAPDIPPAPPASAGPNGPPGSLAELEVAAIRAALAASGGNMSQAALRLRIGRATLYRKSRKYGILRP
jgi:DNA-binding NtrC family response regulator